MAELKTKKNDEDVEAFLASIENETRRRDSYTVNELMKQVTGEEPKMWGASIVGFGDYAYGKKLDKQWFKIGFSPRKASMTLYIMDGFGGRDSLLERLGPHSTGKSCLYVKDIEKVDKEVLEDLMLTSLSHMEAAIERGFEGTIPT